MICREPFCWVTIPPDRFFCPVHEQAYSGPRRSSDHGASGVCREPNCGLHTPLDRTYCLGHEIERITRPATPRLPDRSPHTHRHVTVLERTMRTRVTLGETETTVTVTKLLCDCGDIRTL